MSRGRAFGIRGEPDVAEIALAARDAALALGLGTTEAVQLATAVSEIAGNLLRHAGGGTVLLRTEADGVVVEARDAGPGIEDLRLALTDGYSTGGSLGLGLPGARRLVDEFAITSKPGEGTVVRLAKRLTPGGPPPVAAADLADCAVVAGSGASATAVVQPHAGGLLLAVAYRGGETLRARPAPPPATLVETAGGADVAVVQLAAQDGHAAWQAEPGAAALVRRDRLGARGPLLLQAPRGRSATFGLLREDVLVLASFTPPDVPGGDATPEHIAAAVADAGPAGAVVLAARVRRGVFERRRR